MGQAESLSRNSGQTNRLYSSVRKESIYSKRIQHEGLLKLRPVPFKNCIEIQTESGSIFLENIQINLKDLLDSRLYTNKLFPKEDIERLIENVTYTMAYLAQKNVPYKDISPDNIFYDNGSFKLLPNDLISQSRYQRFLTSRSNKKTTSNQHSTSNSNQFITISPEMIIAYRCKQPVITELDILDKSNVFCLGLILLETCTLLPSYECYDEDTCDILDQVVTERIELVKEYYSDQIASIVANMLDYDYSERMSLKEVSIFINRELNRDLVTNSKIVKELSNKKSSKPQRFIDVPPSSDPTVDDTQSVVNHSQTKSAISKSRLEQTQEADSRISRPSNNLSASASQNLSVSEKKRNKTNRVYMNGGLQIEPEQESVNFPITKEERNKIYMKQPQMKQSNDSKRPIFGNEQGKSQGILKQIPHTSNIIVDSRVQQSGKIFDSNRKDKYSPQLPAFSQKNQYYQLNNEEDEENRYPQHEKLIHTKTMKRKNSSDYIGYRATNQPRNPKDEKEFYHNSQSQNRFDCREQYNEQSLNNDQTIYSYKRNDRMKEDSNFRYQPQRNEVGFGHRFGQKEQPQNEDLGSRGYFETRPAKGGAKQSFKEQDNSLSRIKSQIERSRKLIEEFKRGDNVQFS